MSDIGPTATIIGIDPGVHGGLVALFPDGMLKWGSMPKDMAGIWKWIEGVCRLAEVPIVACLEKVGGFIAGKEGKQPGSHMFTFGRNCGALEMALVGNGFQEMRSGCSWCRTLVLVPPQRWQKALGIPPRITRGADKESKEDWKRRLKREAQKRFPHLLVPKDMADALLIADYCKTTYGGASCQS